jgi:hypothetical protein
VFRPPPRLANGGRLQGLLGAAPRPFSVFLLLLGRCLRVSNFSELRLAELRNIAFLALC